MIRRFALLLASLALLMTLTLAQSAAGRPTPALAAGPLPAGVQVLVGYADDNRANAANFPTPWAGDPGVVFDGCTGSCSFDAGAIQIANSSGTSYTVDSVVATTSDNGCTYTWSSPGTLGGFQEVIVTQTATGANNGCTGPNPANFDSSDIGPNGQGWSGSCSNSGVTWSVTVSLNGGAYAETFTDNHQVLNTGGIDLASCPNGTNESTSWSPIGGNACGPATLTLAPATQTHSVGTNASVTATFKNGCGDALQGAHVTFNVTAGPNNGKTGSGTTDAGGNATFTYSSVKTGTDTLTASVSNPGGTITSNSVTVTWTLVFAPGGAFVIGNQTPQGVGATVPFWGAQWAKDNTLSGGSAPASFKGFEDGNAAPACGAVWTAAPGNSSPPPNGPLPADMGVIVSSSVSKSGSTISGNIVHIIVVHTNSGYGPDPGHAGTGVVEAQIC